MNSNLNTMSGAMIAFYAMLVIWSVIIYWRMFKKANQPGWAVLVPFYDVYVINKLAKVSHVWTVVIVFCSLILIFSASAISASMLSFADFMRMSVFAVISAPVFIAVIAMIIWDIILSINIAKWFELPGWFALGIFLLPIVFIGIIAFNRNIHYNFGSGIKETILIKEF